jgi:HEAT repeat protein
MTDGERRRDAVLAGHDGDEETARQLLADESAVVRAAARRALRRMGRLDGGDVAVALVDPDPRGRAEACALAVDVPEADVAALLRDEAPSVVEAAAWALGERGDAAAVPDLAEVARSHEDGLCREAAVAALGAIGDESGLPAILAAMADRATVRRRAVLALAPFEGAEVDAALTKAANDRDWQVRQAAEDLITD